MNATEIYVRDWMSLQVKTIREDTLVADAYNTMMKFAFRRLPVVDSDRLVGIVSLGDLREARPSPRVGVSLYELNYVLSKLTVGEIMTYQPFTVKPDTHIQDAARIMLDRKVGGLPVLNDYGELVGIITESDIFRMLMDQWDYSTVQRVEPGLVSRS